MKKNAFILSETLVMTTVILLILIVCYYPFSRTINDNVTYNTYDNIEDIYKLNNVRMYIYKYIGVNNILGSNTDKIIPIKTIYITNDGDSNIKYNYERLLESCGIDNIYITNYNLTESDINSKTFSYDLKEYLKYINNATTLNNEGEELENTYRLVAKFDSGTYSNIKIWKDGEV